MLEAVCPNGHRLQIPPEHAGMKLRCPACNVIFQLAGVPQGAGSGGTAAPTGAGPNHPTTPPPPAAPNPVAGGSAGTADGGRWAGGDAPASTPPPAAAPRAPGFAPRSVDFAGSARTWSQLVLMLGLLLVISARGCDGLAMRNIARLQGDVQLAKNVLTDEEFTESNLYRRQAVDNDLAQSKRDDAQKKLAEIRAKYEKRRNELEAGEWYALTTAARDAVALNQSWGYWREMAFLVGTIVFSLGLLGLMFVGVGAERYLCFGLLVIIVFSIYIGGTAWFGSMVGALSGLTPALR